MIVWREWFALVLHYFEVAGKRYQIDPEELEIEEVLSTITEQHATFIAEKQLKIDLQITEGTFLRADLELIKRVLSILLENAIYFSPAKGDITIQAHKINEEKARISVRDEGKGIKEEYLKEIFNAFALGQHERQKSGGMVLIFPLRSYLCKHTAAKYGRKVKAKKKEPDLFSKFNI